jgi:hypothetical protein
MKIHMAPLECPMTVVRVLDDLYSARLENLHSAIEIILLNGERVMMSVLTRPVRIHVVGNAGQHKEGAAALHKGIPFVRAKDFTAEHLMVETSRRYVVSHADGEVQYACCADRIGCRHPAGGDSGLYHDFIPREARRRRVTQIGPIVSPVTPESKLTRTRVDTRLRPTVDFH